MAEIDEALTGRAPGAYGEVDRLHKRVEDLRSDIGDDVWELQRRVRAAFDFRLQLAKHPLVVATVVLGVVIGTVAIVDSLLRGWRKRQNRPSRR